MIARSNSSSSFSMKDRLNGLKVSSPGYSSSTALSSSSGLQTKKQAYDTQLSDRAKEVSRVEEREDSAIQRAVLDAQKAGISPWKLNFSGANSASPAMPTLQSSTEDLLKTLSSALMLLFLKG